MKKQIFTLFLVTALCPMAYSQVRVPLPEKIKLSRPNINMLDAGLIENRPFSKTILKLPIVDIKGTKNTLQTTEFALKEENPATDPFGLQHYQYTQTINGIEVEGAEVRVHVRKGMVENQTGNWLIDVPAQLKTLRPAKTPNDILATTQASLKGAKIVTHDLQKTTSPNARSISTPAESQLVYVPATRNNNDFAKGNLRLAYKFTLSTGFLSNWLFYVDAITGEVLHKRDLVCRLKGVTSATSAQHLNTRPTAPTVAGSSVVLEKPANGGTLWTRYSGKRTSNTTLSADNTYRLKDLGRNIEVVRFDSAISNETTTAYLKIFETPYSNTSNQWTLKSDSTLDGYEHDLFWGSQQMYDLFTEKFNEWPYTTRKNGGTIKAYNLVDFAKYGGETSYNTNLAYDGNALFAGKGELEKGISPFVTLDITAHELAHGMTLSKRNVYFFNEAGSINEALSDIFGTAVEYYKRPERWDWILSGETGQELRNLKDPNALSNPKEVGGKYFSNIANNDDTQGVYENSTIVGHWFYLLAMGGKGTNEAGTKYDIKGIGFDDAFKLVYYTQRNYLTASMGFYEFSQETIKLAKTMFTDQNKGTQVANAWAAVNVLKPVNPATCTDTYEPNNTGVTARSISIGTTVYGTLEDYAVSVYNAGDQGETTEIVEEEGAERFADWFKVTTTAAKPKIKVTIKHLLSDGVVVGLFRDTPDNFLYGGAADLNVNVDKITAKPGYSQTEFDIVDNDNAPHTYYLKVIAGSNDALSDLLARNCKYVATGSKGCYELLVTTSTLSSYNESNPKDVTFINEDNRSFFASQDNVFYLQQTVGEEPENKIDPVLSLSSDIDYREGSSIVAALWDSLASNQLWTPILTGKNAAGINLYAFRNLNTDKVIQYNGSKAYVQATYNPNNQNQKFRFYSFFGHGAVFQAVTQPVNTFLRYNSTTKSFDATGGLCNDPDVSDEPFPCKGANFLLIKGQLLDAGDYIIRAPRASNAALSVSDDGQRFEVNRYRELDKQKWNVSYNGIGRYVITNVASGKAINLPNSSSAEEAIYNQAVPNNTVATQNFKILPSGSGVYKLANSVTNKAISTTSKQIVNQRAYVGSGYQHWSFEKVLKLGAGYYYIQNRVTGDYMAVANRSTAEAAPLVSSGFNGDYNQLFYVAPQTDGSYIVEAVHSGQSLSSQNNVNGNQLVQTNKVERKWHIIYTSGKYFKIISLTNDKAVQLGVDATHTAKGSPIVQDRATLGNLFQHWRFKALGVPQITPPTKVGTANAREGVAEEKALLEATNPEALTEGFILSPNPAQNQVTVSYELAEGEQAEIKLLSPTGTELKSQPAQGRQTVVDISAFGTGLYLMRLQSNTGKRLIQKLIINK